MKLNRFYPLVLVCSIAVSCQPVTSEYLIDQPSIPVVAATPTVADPAVTIWAGTSGTGRFTLSSSEIIFERKDNREGLLSGYLEQIPMSGVESCPVEFTFFPISLVNGLITLEQQSVIRCVGISGNSLRDVRRLTIDTNRKGKIIYSFQSGFDFSNSERLVNLQNFFAEEEIIQALLKIPAIQKNAIRSHKSFRSLETLVRDLKGVGFGVNLNQAFTRESLYGFGFVGLEGSNDVRVSLPLIPMGRRDAPEEIVIVLPIPPNLRDSVVSADSEKGGFMANSQGNYIKKEIKLVVEK